MNPILFAFVGRRGSGKDTAADIIYNIIEDNQIEGISASFAFADPLKDMAHKSLGVTLEQSEFLKRNPSIKIANNQDLRTYYNNFGDIIKSNFGKDIFSELTITKMQESIDSTSINFFTITDVRYPQELAHLKKFCQHNKIKMVAIKMVNTTTPDIDNSHESESLSDSINCDYIIEAKNPQEIKNKMEIIYNGIFTTT